MAGRGGRGEKLRELLAAKQAAPAQPPGAEGIARLLGRGRARPNEPTTPPLLQTLPISLGRGFSASLPKSESPPPQLPVSSSEQPTDELSKKMKRMTILPDKPPEIHRGSSGNSVQMTANYIRINCQPNKGMFEYYVRFNPEVDAMKMKHDLLSEHRTVLGEGRTFDGAILYLPEKLNEDELTLKSVNKLDGSKVDITITFQRKRTLGECIQFYNVLFKKIMNLLNLVRFNRSHFDPSAAVMIPQHRLEVWPGLVTAIDLYEDGVMLCCDVSSRVLRRVTAYDIIKTAIHANPSNYKDEVIKALLGKSIMTEYNRKLYRIDDVNFDMKPTDTFSKNGKEVTFIDYYRTSYDVQIQDPVQPLLIHRTERKNQLPSQTNQPKEVICLIPELCYMTGLTDEMRADFKVMKDISTVTRVTPNQRQYSLMKFLQNIRENRDATALLRRWGLSLAECTVELPGRLLPPENLYFGKNVIIKGSLDADWGRAATSNHMLNVIHLQKWLVLHTRRDYRSATDFVDTMKQVGPQMGMDVMHPRLESLSDDRIPTYLNALKNFIRDDLQIAVIIFPTPRDDRYAAVKKLTVADLPIATQAINSRTLSQPKKLRSVTQKIALQMNCKLGGTLWGVKIPFKNAMMCGIDTYHDPTKRGYSWGGFVASMNENMTRWYSQAHQQVPGQELIDTLRMAFIMCLKKYHQVNGTFPETIIIFRDGVGDGQMNVCKDYEIPQLMKAFTAVSSTYIPKLAFIVVQKRINTRLFTCSSGRSSDGEFGNPLPGTVMDNTITRRYFFDYFIVSQHVRQGTVSPTHYVVLQNATRFTPDQLQMITYKMCHMYYNWPGTIRVPAPCQYAHKLAQLIGQNVKKQQSDVLSDKLFFL